MRRDIVLCLCDLSGVFAQPWVDNGYRAVLVDPQHGSYSVSGLVTKLPLTVDEASREISDLVRGNRIAFVAGFPPCTDMAVSGARWFNRKYALDPLFQAKAVMVAEQCRTIARMSGAPWFIENPVSVLSSVFGKPQHVFNPWQYSGFCSEDNYVKKTCLWTGGGYIHPAPRVQPGLGKPDHRIWTAPPSADRANFRSRTPLGFSRAVYAANKGRW